MQKIVKIFLVLGGLIFIGLMLRGCYKVLCISCTPDPVKTYDYPGSMDQLENNFKNFAADNHSIYYNLSRRGADPKDARDITIKLEINNNDIECHLVIYDFNESTELDIDEIFDNTHKKGGNNASDQNVKMLLIEFENSFMTPFKKDQKIEFKRRFFNF